MTETKCAACGCDCAVEESTVEDVQTQPQQDDSSFAEETQLAVLLALVPAMTMSLFNMMGLL